MLLCGVTRLTYWPHESETLGSNPSGAIRCLQNMKNNKVMSTW